MPVLAQDKNNGELCIDYFGVGAVVKQTCRPFPGSKRKIDPSELATALADGVANLRIVSDDRPEEPYVLSSLSDVSSIHSLDLFLVGEVDLTPVQDMKGLRRLDLSIGAALALGQITSEMSDLVELRLYAPNRVIDLSALSKMPELRVLYVDADAITGLESLGNLSQLQRVQFRLSEETDFSVLSKLTQLERLEISGKLGKSVLSDIKFVAPLTSLVGLDLADNRIEDLKPLADLEGLKLLVLSGNRKLSDISPLSGLTGLNNLQLRHTNVSDLTSIQNMTELGILWLDRAPVSDIGPLEGLPKLWGLELSRTQVTDITPLRHLPLQHLSLRGTDVTDFSAVPSETKLKK